MNTAARSFAYSDAKNRSAPDADRAPDYATWTIEELRAFAQQLQLPNASHQNRRELLEIFDVG